MEMEFCCPVLFGLEGIVADELRYGGVARHVKAENGKIYFTGDVHTLVWANLWLRCAERVLIRIGSFPARSFEELFEGVRDLPWEHYITKGGKFPVKGHALNSRLHSIPDCQKIVKKAVADRLSKTYAVQWLPEDGELYQIQFSIMKDQAELFLDTSGAGLHKRGYRAKSNAAPLRETLAAAMVKLARYKGREAMHDIFCGSGTIPIEAAMLCCNIAPGLRRSFAAEQWQSLDSDHWRQGRLQAEEAVRHETFPIYAADLDPACVALCRENAEKAGVAHTIAITRKDARKAEIGEKTMLLTNPPYGERLLDMESARRLYADFGKRLAQNPAKQYILSSDEEFETYFGALADKKRKLYNGMIKCNLFMYFKDISFRKYTR